MFLDASVARGTRGVLRAAQTRTKKPEGRNRDFEGHTYLLITVYAITDIWAQHRAMPCPCAHTAGSFDSGTTDAIPAYIKRRPTHIPGHGKCYPVGFRV